MLNVSNNPFLRICFKINSIDMHLIFSKFYAFLIYIMLIYSPIYYI